MLNQLSILIAIAALPMAAQDNSWKTEIDNSLVQVSRRLVTPRETAPSAEMPPASLVFLTDYAVRITGVAPQEVKGKPFQFFWHPGGRIGLENMTDNNLEIALIAPKAASASGPTRA